MWDAGITVSVGAHEDLPSSSAEEFMEVGTSPVCLQW